jgi:hypothetical protein
MNKRGFTLLELLVGLVTATVIGAVTAQIMKAGIMTYNFSVRQNAAMTRTRKALGGMGSATGIMPESRAAVSFAGINGSTVSVVSSSNSVVVSYYVAGSNLLRSKTGSTIVLSDEVTRLSVNYYNMDAVTRLIRVSSAASLATLVTSSVTLKGNSSRQKDYYLYSGALLRNHL